MRKATIAGPVEYREGDGGNLAIPRGPCEVEEAASDVTIAWQDGESRGAASLPVANYKKYLASGAIKLAD